MAHDEDARPPRAPQKPEESPPERTGFTRRGFITSVGAGVVVTATAGRLEAERPGVEAVEPEAGAPVSLRVNGRVHRLLVEPRWTLLFVLRERLGLTGTKPGCERGECGACTVLLDGEARYSCLTLALEAAGREILTVEGLLDGERLGPVQQSFAEHDALQCGYCTPGQIMAAEGLLRQLPAPTAAEIRHGMSGNLCRCGAYPNIASAVAEAARRRGGPS
jgi:xanthine dehydrogenase YagT iron-sulfur-binding subunit